MKAVSLALVGALFIGTTGCGDGVSTEDEIADAAADATADLEYENEQLQARASELEAALEEANSNIEEARNDEGGSYEEMSDGLGTLETVDEP